MIAFAIFWYWFLIAYLGSVILSVNKNISLKDAAATWVFWPLMVGAAIVASFLVCLLSPSNSRAAVSDIWQTLRNRIF